MWWFSRHKSVPWPPLSFRSCLSVFCRPFLIKKLNQIISKKVEYKFKLKKKKLNDYLKLLITLKITQHLPVNLLLLNQIWVWLPLGRLNVLQASNIFKIVMELVLVALPCFSHLLINTLNRRLIMQIDIKVLLQFFLKKLMPLMKK